MRTRTLMKFHLIMNTLILMKLLMIFTGQWILNIPIFLLAMLLIIEMTKMVFGSYSLLQSKRHCPECGINITNYSGHRIWDEPTKKKTFGGL